MNFNEIYRVENTSLHFVAARGVYILVSYILNRNKDSPARDDDGKALLHLTLSRGFRSTVRVLLDYGVGADIIAKDNGRNPSPHNSSE